MTPNPPVDPTEPTTPSRTAPWKWWLLAISALVVAAGLITMAVASHRAEREAARRDVAYRIVSGDTAVPTRHLDDDELYYLSTMRHCQTMVRALETSTWNVELMELGLKLTGVDELADQLPATATWELRRDLAHIVKMKQQHWKSKLLDSLYGLPAD